MGRNYLSMSVEKLQTDNTVDSFHNKTLLYQGSCPHIFHRNWKSWNCPVLEWPQSTHIVLGIWKYINFFLPGIYVKHLNDKNRICLYSLFRGNDVYTLFLCCIPVQSIPWFHIATAIFSGNTKIWRAAKFVSSFIITMAVHYHSAGGVIFASDCSFIKSKVAPVTRFFL